jgi:YD repeat-containing protein
MDFDSFAQNNTHTMTAVLKSMTLYRAMHIEGLDEEEILKHEFVFQVSKYDTAGKLLTEESYLSDNSLEHRYSYRYNESGQLVEEKLEEGDDFISEHKTMEYDNEGRLLRVKLHYLDDTYDESEYHYDSKGRLIERSVTDSDGEAGNRTLITYNGDLLISEKEFDQEGGIISGKSFEYDEKGNLLSEEEEGTDFFRVAHTYDDAGLRTFSRKYDQEGHLIEKQSYMFDDQGRSTEVKEESRNGVEIQKIEYDERGNIIHQDSYNDKEELLSKIERQYNSDNRIVTTRVRVEGSGQRPPQDYRIRFDYEYYQ